MTNENVYSRSRGAVFPFLLLRTGHSCRCPPSRRARRGSSSLRGPMVSNTECPLGCVGGLTTCSVFHSSTHFTTRTSPRKGVLLKRLRLFAQRCRSPLSVFRSCQTFDASLGIQFLAGGGRLARAGLLARSESGVAPGCERRLGSFGQSADRRFRDSYL